MTKEHSTDNGTELLRIPLQLGGEYRISVVYDRSTGTGDREEDYSAFLRDSLDKAKKKLSQQPTRLKSNGRLRPMKEYRQILRQREDHLAKVERALDYLDGRAKATLKVIEQFDSEGEKQVVGFQILYNN